MWITYVRIGYTSISSHAVDYVPVTAWNWDSPLSRIPHFCRGLSLTLPRTNACFSQSSSVVVRGRALLNRSRNTAITWDMICPVCCLSRTHTLATKRSSIEWLLVSVMRKTTKFCGCGKSHMHYLGLPTYHFTSYCVLCCVNLNWVWGAYCVGVQWLLVHSVGKTHFPHQNLPPTDTGVCLWHKKGAAFE
jgi:hypothetical protein